MDNTVNDENYKKFLREESVPFSEHTIVRTIMEQFYEWLSAAERPSVCFHSSNPLFFHLSATQLPHGDNRGRVLGLQQGL